MCSASSAVVRLGTRRRAHAGASSPPWRRRCARGSGRRGTSRHRARRPRSRAPSCTTSRRSRRRWRPSSCAPRRGRAAPTPRTPGPSDEPARRAPYASRRRGPRRGARARQAQAIGGRELAVAHAPERRLAELVARETQRELEARGRRAGRVGGCVAEGFEARPGVGRQRVGVALHRRLEDGARLGGVALVVEDARQQRLRGAPVHARLRDLLGPQRAPRAGRPRPGARAPRAGGRRRP